MRRGMWFLKQILPLLYVSEYTDHDDTRKICVWRMWFGRAFAIREWSVC